MSEKQVRGEGLHVLHIDDDDLVRGAVAMLIQNSGHRCESLPTNRNFPPILAKQKGFDVIIHDGQIPDGTHGKDWLREFGTLDSKTPRVLISGDVLEKDIPELLKEGIIAFGKPFESAQFNALLAKLHAEKIRRLGANTRGEMRGGVFIPSLKNALPRGHSATI